jgi:hypothetical protein
MMFGAPAIAEQMIAHCSDRPVPHPGVCPHHHRQRPPRRTAVTGLASTVLTTGRSEIDGHTPDLAFAQISESVVGITAPTFTDVAIAAFRRVQAWTGEAREPHHGRREKRALAGASALLASFCRSLPATRWPYRRRQPARLFGAPAAEQDHMTQIGLADRRHDAVNVLPLLRKIWQRNVQRGQDKDCLC